VSFRFSRDNVVTWVGIVLLVVGIVGLFRRTIAAILGARDESDTTSLLLSIPWWVFVIVIVVGFAVAVIGSALQVGSRLAHDTAFEDYAVENNWTRYPAPRWVGESKTWPLDGSRHLAAGAAFVGDFCGYWGTALIVQNLGGPTGTESLGSYQIIGLPFDDDMPRVHLIPRDAVESSREMAGGKRIDFESAAFNDKWRVRGEDAKRVHDIVHPRTMERLLRPDALSQPIIIDGGAIWTWRATPVYGAEFEAVLSVLRDVAVAIPAFLYDELNTRLLVKRTDDLHADWVTSRRGAGIAQRDEYDTLDRD
jgi:hypothetical protein